MKITKTKKVETVIEEIDVKDGIYFFSLGYRDEEPSYYFKVVIETGDWEDGFADIIVEQVMDVYQDYHISYKQYFDNYLVPRIEYYFKKENEFDNWYEDITEEEFEAAKERVKQKL